jgi:hypothetical protein
MFFDSETGFRIVRKETKEVTKIGERTRQWVNGGGLIVCKEETPIVVNRGEPVPDINEPSPQENVIPEPEQPKEEISIVSAEDAAQQLFESSSVEMLKAMAKKRGLKVRKNMDPIQIAKNIVTYDREPK